MNKVYALIGPPASGKTSIIKELNKYGVAEIISHTTRPPKNGEQHGVDYYFISNDEFSKTQLIERVNYSGYFYGLSKAEVMDKVKQYPISVVTVDAYGMEQLTNLLGDHVKSIYIMVDKSTIIGRIIEKGENADSIKHRIEYAEKAGEFDSWQIADYVVKNTASLDIAVRQILAIMGLLEPAKIDGSDNTME